MPSFPSTAANAFNMRAEYTVEDAVSHLPLRAQEIDFVPALVIPLNVFQIEHARTLVRGRADTDTIWLTLVVVDKEGAVTQFVLQAKANMLGPKVSGKRDGSLGVGAWVNSKLHPKDEIHDDNRVVRAAKTELVSDKVLEEIAESVAVNYYSQEEGETRHSVSEALGEFHTKLATLLKKSSHEKTRMTGLQEGSARKRRATSNGDSNSQRLTDTISQHSAEDTNTPRSSGTFSGSPRTPATPQEH